jgi:hypothetical protein
MIHEFFKAGVIFVLLGVSPVLGAVDCAKIKPFRSFKKGQTFKIEATQLTWKTENGTSVEDAVDICKVDGKIQAYDIRGREDEALVCLKPDKKTVYSCETTLNGKPAKIYFLPAVWVRTWKPKDAREYRFHAVVQSDANANDYIDVFARSLSFNIKAADTVTEGAIKNGPQTSKEGFFVRAYFQK